MAGWTTMGKKDHNMDLKKVNVPKNKQYCKHDSQVVPGN